MFRPLSPPSPSSWSSSSSLVQNLFYRNNVFNAWIFFSLHIYFDGSQTRNKNQPTVNKNEKMWISYYLRVFAKPLNLLHSWIVLSFSVVVIFSARVATKQCRRRRWRWRLIPKKDPTKSIYLSHIPFLFRYFPYIPLPRWRDERAWMKAAVLWRWVYNFFFWVEWKLILSEWQKITFAKKKKKNNWKFARKIKKATKGWSAKVSNHMLVFVPFNFWRMKNHTIYTCACFCGRYSKITIMIFSIWRQTLFGGGTGWKPHWFRQ